MRVLGAAGLVLLLTGCLFDTKIQEPNSTANALDIRPDLHIGNQWMYRFRQFVKYENDSAADTLNYFIHYRILGDSSIAGDKYRILTEEDLAIFNDDYGLVKNKSFYAVRSDGAGTTVNQLKGGDHSTGRLPFKSAAGSAFDTVYFEDETRTLQLPLAVNESWIFRAAGSPFGHAAATKTFLGLDEIDVQGKTLAATKFQVIVQGMEHIRTMEWYADDYKINSRATMSVSNDTRDSLHWEEEYLGKRDFTQEDTLIVRAGAAIPP